MDCCAKSFRSQSDQRLFCRGKFSAAMDVSYETPSGIIMKINRNPLPELSDEIFKKDHEFWSKYSQRLIGNWITYDTSVQEIADFVEKVYLQIISAASKATANSSATMTRKKSFSKLRSSHRRRLCVAFRAAMPTRIPPENRGVHTGVDPRNRFCLQAILRLLPLQPGGGFPLREFSAPAGNQPSRRRVYCGANLVSSSILTILRSKVCSTNWMTSKTIRPARPG